MGCPTSVLGPAALVIVLALAASQCAQGNPDEWCGDGQLNLEEQCDGDQFGLTTCATLQQGSGTLACSDDCQTIITAGCSGPTCGNGQLDGGEACDGSELGGKSCISEFFTGGELRCTDQCALDTSACTMEQCGNGLLNPGEACDDGNNNVSDGCDAACRVEDGWSCNGEPSLCVQVCGNGTIDVGENCDGVNLGGATCTSLGYDSGTVACGADCLYDTSFCVGAPPCGNGVIEGTEQCDGVNLNGASCTTLGFDSGLLTCASDCSYDTSLCVAATCGNGQIDTGEDCDGVNLGGATCVSEGFSGGSLTCGVGCSFDTSSCISVACGNGSVDAGEQCDGADLGGATCVGLGYTSGSLACLGDCNYDTSSCVSNATCGNGNVEIGEGCDDGNTTAGDGCDGSCQPENSCSADYALACGSSAANNFFLVRLDDDVNFLSCSTLDGTSSEDIYSFTPTTSGNASISLDVVQDAFLFGDDMDLYVLEGGCHPNLCLIGSEDVGDDSVSVPVVAGVTYYIVVERPGFGFPPTGDYGLTLTCP